MLRSEGRGRSLAQVHSLPTCRLPTAHSGPELDWGCSDFQRKRKALERPQLAPSLLLLPPPVCCPLAAQGSGLFLGRVSWLRMHRGPGLTPKSSEWRPKLFVAGRSTAGQSACQSTATRSLEPLGPPGSSGRARHPLHVEGASGARVQSEAERARVLPPLPAQPLLPTLGPQHLGHQGYGLEAHPIPKGSSHFRDCDAELCLGCASGGCR